MKSLCEASMNVLQGSWIQHSPLESTKYYFCASILSGGWPLWGLAAPSQVGTVCCPHPPYIVWHHSDVEVALSRCWWKKWHQAHLAKARSTACSLKDRWGLDRDEGLSGGQS